MKRERIEDIAEAAYNGLVDFLGVHGLKLPQHLWNPLYVVIESAVAVGAEVTLDCGCIRSEDMTACRCARCGGRYCPQHWHDHKCNYGNIDIKA